MTVDELLQEIREDFLDDAVEPYRWGQSRLRRWLSRAQEEACMRQRLLVDSSTPAICDVTLVADQPDYVLDPRIVLVEKVTLDGVPIEKRTEDQLDRTDPSWRTPNSGSGVLRYLQNELTITLLATPTAAEHDKTLKLRVQRLPLVTFTSGSQSPEIPIQYHRDLIWYVIATAFDLPDEDTQNTRKADEYMARFDAAFGPALRADVLAHKRREAKTSFIGNPHAYHGRRSTPVYRGDPFDFED